MTRRYQVLISGLEAGNFYTLDGAERFASKAANGQDEILVYRLIDGWKRGECVGDYSKRERANPRE